MHDGQTGLGARIHRHGGSEVIALETVAIPDPLPGEVVVRVVTAAINPVDWKLREGSFGPPLPITLGQDFAGIVEKIGVEVGRFKIGDAVFGMLGLERSGAFAEFVASPANWLALKPKELSFETAAALPMGALTAWIALYERGGLMEGQRVLVHAGAGAVGSMAVQLAKTSGAWVAATASGEGIERVQSIGADLVIDYRNERFENRIQAIGGVDLVLDTLAGETRERSWAVLRNGGAMVSTLGATQPPANRSDLRGLPGFGAGPDGERLQAIAALAGSGALRPFIEAVVPLAEVASALDRNQSGQAKGKIVLRIGKNPGR